VSGLPAQEARFFTAVLANRHIQPLLDRMAGLALEDWYLAGGCLFQTVWNQLHGFAPDQGILDYDLLYFNAAHASVTDEERMQRAASQACADVPVRIEVCNQARVHEWYESRFGVPSLPFQRCSDGIDAFLGCCCSLGIRKSDSGLSLYAPHGLRDLFDLVLRPNPRRARQGGALAAAYAEKAARWKTMWPKLTVIPWLQCG
jgi:hypothetical protein